MLSRSLALGLCLSLALPAFAMPGQTVMTCEQIVNGATPKLLNIARDTRSNWITQKELLAAIDQREADFEKKIQDDIANRDFIGATANMLFGFRKRSRIKKARKEMKAERKQAKARVKAARLNIVGNMQDLFDQYPDSRQAVVNTLWQRHNGVYKALRKYIETSEEYKLGISVTGALELANAAGFDGVWPGMLIWYYFAVHSVSKEDLPQAFANVQAVLKDARQSRQTFGENLADFSALDKTPPEHFMISLFLDPWGWSSEHFNPVAAFNLFRMGTRYLQIRDVLSETSMRAKDVKRYSKLFEDELDAYLTEMSIYINENRDDLAGDSDFVF